MAEYVQYEEPEGPRMYKFGKYSFSSIEIFHLSFAFIMITLTLMAFSWERMVQELGIIEFIIVNFFTIGLGFVLHELGHKFVAQYFGKVSEFRADFFMLFVMFFIAWFSPFILLAPGAVMILGNITRRQNGIISVAGPSVNLVLAAIFAVIAVIFNPNFNSLLGFTIWLGIWVNSFLGIFNMLPFWVLDGKKVLVWNKGVYFLVMSGLFFFLIGSIFGWFVNI